MGFTPSWVAALHRFRHLVGTFWCIIMMLGVYHGESTIRAITSDLAVIEGRPQPAFMCVAMRGALTGRQRLTDRVHLLAAPAGATRSRRPPSSRPSSHRSLVRARPPPGHPAPRAARRMRAAVQAECRGSACSTPRPFAGEKAIVRVRRLDRQFVLSEKTESFCKSLAQVRRAPAAPVTASLPHLDVPSAPACDFHPVPPSWPVASTHS